MEALRAVDVAVVVGDDLVAGLVKPFGDLGTYSAGPPGDDRHARHCLLPSAVFLQSRPATGGNNDDRRPPYRSRQMAMPMPPPIHRVASPRRASRARIACSRVMRMRVPEAPIGWPRAMAPPLTFTFAGSDRKSTRLNS